MNGTADGTRRSDGPASSLSQEAATTSSGLRLSWGRVQDPPVIPSMEVDLSSLTLRETAGETRSPLGLHTPQAPNQPQAGWGIPTSVANFRTANSPAIGMRSRVRDILDKSTPSLYGTAFPPQSGSDYPRGPRIMDYNSVPLFAALPEHIRHGTKPTPHPYDQRIVIHEAFSDGTSPATTDRSSVPSRGAPVSFSSGRAPGSNSTSSQPQETVPTTEKAPDPAPVGDVLFDHIARIRAEPTYTTPYAVTVNFPGYVARRLLFFSNPSDAETALSDLLSLNASRELDAPWITGLTTYAPLLKALLRLADAVTPVEKTLNPKSPCAKVIDKILERYTAQGVLSHACGPDVEGSVGMRYIIQKARSSESPLGQWPAPPIRTGEITVQNIVDHALYILNQSGAESIASINAIRLVESVLPGVHTIGELQRQSFREFIRAVGRILKRRDLRGRTEGPEADPARRIAALHLVSSTLRTYKSLLERSKSTCQTPWTPDEEWVLHKIGVQDALSYLEDDNARPLVRCMALRVIRDFGEVILDDVKECSNLNRIIKLSVSVLLWQTEWQNGHESTAQSLDIVGFSPHDDAYQILSVCPPKDIIAGLSLGLDVEKKSQILEPLLSLIVDHSDLKDKYWPLMLGMLIHSGCLSTFRDILSQSIDQDQGTWHNVGYKMKSNACIALHGCLEQIRAKDMSFVPSDLGNTLVTIIEDESHPLPLRNCASDALRALRETLPLNIKNVEAALPTPVSSLEGSSQGMEDQGGSSLGSNE